jgi:hypothetical protein
MAQTYYTYDGVEITPGLRVWTHNACWGTVDADQVTRGGSCDPGGEYFDGFFRVNEETGSCPLLNGERMSVRKLY